ncbi:hypothetical protein NDU88_002791 [Pleurodeles waltl]|uniref:Uncharacterized protein n=1 Tax=Pleurodeles waltl TaxID=8319 RepID=A0AAV7VFD9_PLEWA|nr:hypothetical protein NDU88_002791 [Pleurodeles waltl]
MLSRNTEFILLKTKLQKDPRDLAPCGKQTRECIWTCARGADSFRAPQARPETFRWWRLGRQSTAGSLLCSVADKKPHLPKDQRTQRELEMTSDTACLTTSESTGL